MVTVTGTRPGAVAVMVVVPKLPPVTIGPLRSGDEAPPKTNAFGLTLATDGLLLVSVIATPSGPATGTMVRGSVVDWPGLTVRVGMTSTVAGTRMLGEAGLLVSTVI